MTEFIARIIFCILLGWIVGWAAWRLIKMVRADLRKKPKWLGWYEEPVSGRRLWLAVYDSDTGYHFTDSKSFAMRFARESAARAVLPVYDGSKGIAERTGVEAVYE